jgi:DNA-binding NtrC family response regulator
MNSQPDVSLVIIDDNPGSLELLSAALEPEGIGIFTAQDPEEGLEIVYREHPQIVLTDLVMPGLSGLDVLDRVVEFDAAIDVILMTAHYSSESAVEAIRKGAADYLNKPVSLTALRERIHRIVEESRQRQRSVAVDRKMVEDAQFEGMVGRSPAMWEMFSRIRRVAPHYRTVLVTGETGTGKELAARALHNLSPVNKGHFVVLNCSAVVETLFESELFGHVRGSFTGAAQDKMGLFEYADKGTIFLDEIGDMPLGTQAKLLRTLQNQEVLRVGSLTPRKIDVRVIAATHRDLRAAIAEKQFREDLYYRLSMVEIQAPSLEARKEDLQLLTRYLLDKFSRQFRKEIRGLTQRAQIVLARHHWPGNIRELESTVSRAALSSPGRVIRGTDVDFLHANEAQADSTRQRLPSLADAERTHIVRVLEAVNWNKKQAASVLEISRGTLYRKIVEYGLESEQRPSRSITKPVTA